MIGPGTGVAPFRGFVQERAAIGAGGRNWLFFGNRNFRSDFLYQLEWQRALKSGQLHRLDLAFSRDPVPAAHAGSATPAGAVSPPRTYVQQRLRARGRDPSEWTQGGRSDERRVGREVCSTCKSRWSQVTEKKKNTKTQ